VNLRSPLDHLNVFKVATRERWDIGTPLALLGLSLFGVFFIYSAQLSAHETVLVHQFWFKQVAFLGLGAGLYVMVSLIDYRFWLSVAHWIYFAALIPLVLVLLLLNASKDRWGSQRWINLGFFQYQPSETVKIAVLLIVTSILIRYPIGTMKQSLGVLGKLALAVGIPMLLILVQPDLKSAIVLPPMVFSMLYVSKLSSRFFAGALGAFLLIVGVVGLDTWRYAAYMKSNGYTYEKENWGKYEPHSWLPYLHDYQRNRVLAFVSPETIDPKGTGASWNLRQSLISVGSGGLTGKGWAHGTQAQLGYLPPAVAHNDFIFSVIAEEKGFLGSITVLGLFGIVLFNGIRIAGLARDRLGTLLRHRRHRAVRGACVREHRDDHRARAHHGHTASLH